MADDEASAVAVAINAHPEGADAGPKAILDSLQAAKDERFRDMGVQKFKRIYAKVKVAMLQDAAAAKREEEAGASKSGGYKVSAGWNSGCIEKAPLREDVEVVLSRPDVAKKFGMVLGVDATENGGHAITSIRKGGVLDGWNEENTSTAVTSDDILMSVNGKTTFDEMMGELKSSLSCTLKLSKPGLSEAAKEAAEWEKRKARVTAALIPGLKKIIESEFGPGAGDTISRVTQMYERIGSNTIFEEDGELGRIYAPGYLEDLKPQRPWHDTSDYPWCAELCSKFEAIKKELQSSCNKEKLWAPGAYVTSNDAYGKDWKIMGILCADTWQDEERFKVTTEAVKALSKHVQPFEAFFARMPANTTIASHSDNLNYILTCHLALDLEEGCRFKVGNEERPWKEGEALVVDTSYMHSCVNESSKARYVLVFRFWHPGLTKEELRAIQLSHSILVKAGQKK